MVETAIGDYKNICKSGWLEAPFKLRKGALVATFHQNRNTKKCAMHNNESARDLLWFLGGEYLDRVLALAGLKICADRVRAELTEFYHKHN